MPYRAEELFLQSHRRERPVVIGAGYWLIGADDSFDLWDAGFVGSLRGHRPRHRRRGGEADDGVVRDGATPEREPGTAALAGSSSDLRPTSSRTTLMLPGAASVSKPLDTLLTRVHGNERLAGYRKSLVTSTFGPSPRWLNCRCHLHGPASGLAHRRHATTNDAPPAR